MNIFLENVNLRSNSGPNSFANKLIKCLYNKKYTITNKLQDSDVRLCFIESYNLRSKIPLFQRLDGIYFNILQDRDYRQQNRNIKKTYDIATGVIFQTEFNKKLTYEYFGEHKNNVVIHNGADVDLIEKISPLVHHKLDKYDNIWSCASSWRPHKRLNDNINYFLEHSGQNDCLIVAGPTNERINNEKIIYVGEINQNQLLSLYKTSKYFIHLAWLDHCPNVVVDARACGNKIICSSTGGTKEIAGPEAIIIKEEEWDMKPTKLYEPPKIDFSNKINNSFVSDYNMNNVTKKYCDFLSE